MGRGRRGRGRGEIYRVGKPLVGGSLFSSYMFLAFAVFLDLDLELK